MRGVNKVILVGHLGEDPKAAALPSGKAVSNFSVATGESWTDRQTGEKRENTEWHRIVAFDRLGEICNQYLTKGAQVYLEGKLRTRKWQDREGNDRYTTEILASELRMLGGGRDRSESSDCSEAPAAAPRPSSTEKRDEFDDDIPF